MSKFSKMFVKNLKAEEVISMKRLLGVLLAFSLVGSIVGTVAAATSDIGYLTVRCTGTVSVKVGDVDGVNDSGDEVNLYDLGVSTGANCVIVSTQLVVTNNGSGIITKWSLDVTEQLQGTDGITWAATDATYPAWTYAAADINGSDINKVAIAAVFADAQAIDADFAANDILDDTARYYQTTDLQYGPATGGSQYASAATSTANNNMVAPTGGSAARDLYFRVRLPTAVSDQRYRKIAVTVLAEEGL